MLSNTKSWVHARVHFCPKTFPSKGGFHSPACLELCRQLSVVSLKAGFNLICNGSTAVGYDRVLKCSHYNPQDKQQQTADRTGDYRKSSLNNDRRANTRGPEGKSTKRRTTSAKATCPADCCRFRHTMKFDPYLNTFYLDLNRTKYSRQHTNHLSTLYQPRNYP